MKRIYLIDCPGITMPEGDETDIVLRGVVRVENIENPEQYIPRLLERCKKQYLERTYEVSGWKDATEFLAMLARKGGRLLKGGEIDEAAGMISEMNFSDLLVAKMVLNDFLRGKIPWYMPDPSWPDRSYKDKVEEDEDLEVLNADGEDEDEEAEDQSWDGLDVETEEADGNNEGSVTGAQESGDEDERLEDTRPSKKLRRS
jgi:nuclear GTP-binding protein